MKIGLSMRFHVYQAIFKGGLGVALHMRFADLVLYTYLVSHGLEAIGIIGDQHCRFHALGNRLNSVFERLDVFRRQLIDG